MKKEFNEIENFIKKNAYWIYKYINDKVLKDIGIINPTYFVSIIEDIQLEEQDFNILPYLILTHINGTGTMPYTSIRPDTIDFKMLNKEASTYYNYLRFSLENDFLIIELLQSKMGGMPIDADFVKYKKSIQVETFGLLRYIESNEKEKIEKLF